MGLRVSFFLLAVCGPGMVMVAQTPQGALPSATMQPSLDVLKTALGEVRTDKWKGSGAMRSEAETNVASIRRDMEATLPPLLAAADAAPGSASKVLPAYRNVEALYDVVLRVDAAGRIGAPVDQVSALDQALVRLDEGRRALADRVAGNAAATEKRASDLQAKLAAIPPPAPPPPAPVCPTPAPTKKKSRAATKPNAATSH